MRRVAEYARMAEQGSDVDAARRCLAEATDADEHLLHSAMRYGLVSSADAEDFIDAHGESYCIRVGGGADEFWLAPLDMWDTLPSGATVVSPRGLRALGRALAAELSA